MRHPWRALFLAALFTIATTATAVAAGPSGYPYSVLYRFCQQSNCADGASPYSSLIMDAAGNLYGTTAVGGNGNGTVFTPTPGSTGWAETILYNFCSQSNCTDGAVPYSRLTMDSTGNLYGTTEAGGRNHGGTVFKLTPGSAGWTETILYDFCAQIGCADGAFPYAGLLMDGAGNLYGTTTQGGNLTASHCYPYGCGTVFKLTPGSSGWTATVLYSFCAQSNCTDGRTSYASLIMDGAESLYGTTARGGIPDSGTVFKLTPGSTGWTETVLYSFCPVYPCADGAQPIAGVIMDEVGNLYGTTFAGNPTGNGGYGVVFQLVPDTKGEVWTEKVLYGFCSQQKQTCSDGAYPAGGLIIDGAGNLYGATAGGGISNGTNSGVVFKLTPEATGWIETVLYTFCSQSNCADGGSPHGDLTVDGAGNLYGTTGEGGGSCSLNVYGCGVVFQLTIGDLLTVTKLGGGTVSSTPSGINCGATCSAVFPQGTQVTLTAAPAAGWGLAGWDGACSGVASSCTVTMNADTSVSAGFGTLFTAAPPPAVGFPTDTPLPPPLIAPVPQ